jgi:hypothetical protein
MTDVLFVGPQYSHQKLPCLFIERMNTILLFSVYIECPTLRMILLVLSNDINNCYACVKRMSFYVKTKFIICIFNVTILTIFIVEFQNYLISR